MKLNKLYSNKANIFRPVRFVPGLNVVIGEIRLPENRDRDTHNLGKTTLGRLIDFCFLMRRDPRFFLFEHYTRFEDFEFILEITLQNGSNLSIKRSVKQASRISFKHSAEAHQDYSKLPEASWDHANVPFDKAKQVLDSYLNLTALKPYDFRKMIGYLIRSQEDFRDVFQLRRFAGSHSDWKPFVAHLLGFDGKMIERQYTKELELESKTAELKTLVTEFGQGAADESTIDGLLLLKRQEERKLQVRLQEFDFRGSDSEITENLVEEIDVQIADLNAVRYTLSRNIKKIKDSLQEDKIVFNPNSAKRLFQEAGVLFGGQIKKDFEQLIAFNKAITKERQAYLEEELGESLKTLDDVKVQIEALGKKRVDALKFLSETDVFEKYKSDSDRLVTLRADIEGLLRQKTWLQKVQTLRGSIKKLNDEISDLRDGVATDLKKKNGDEKSKFSQLRLHFNDIVEEVLDRKALLSVSMNTNGHLEFHADILDAEGNTTSQGSGTTYRKLMCIAYDLAVLRVHTDAEFPRFVFHDGIFETLDDRKKENLLRVLHKYAAVGIQYIGTVIDSDLPSREAKSDAVFSSDEVILKLHDDGEKGRLFRMDPW